MATIIILILDTLGILLLLCLFFKNKKIDNTENITKADELLFEKNERGLKSEMALSRKEFADSEKRLREELAGLFKGFGDSLGA